MVDVKRIVTVIEDIRSEGGVRLVSPQRRVACMAVIDNPFAGDFETDLSLLIDAGEELGALLGDRAVAALDSTVESYGKGGIVGMRGEREHVAALLHPKLGAPLRNAVGGAAAIIPSAKKRGCPGSTLDVPVHYKDAAFVRSHFDAMEIRVPDAPADDEIVLAVVVTNGGRPHARVGGLAKEDAQGQDGLR